MATDTPIAVDPLAEVGDGSTVSDRNALDQLIAQETAELKKGISGYRGMTTVLKRVASLRCAMRRLIVASNGHPDWSAGTDAYRLTIAAAESTVWADATADEKRRVDGAIRQHISRTFLEPAIVAYVLATVNGMPKEGDLKWTEAKGDTPAVLAGDIPSPLQKAVAAEYRAAKLTVPPKFGGAVKPNGNGGGPEKQDPANVRAEFEGALGALETVAPAVTADLLLRSISALSTKLLGEFEIKDRPQVIESLKRIGQVAILTGQNLDGKGDEKTQKSLEAALWTK